MGTKVSDFAIGDSNIESVMLTLDKAYKNQDSITLTEIATTTIPEIAGGGWCENNGALYKFDIDEAISTTDPVTSATVADGTVYICLIPAVGTASGATTDATGYSIGATVITLASAGTGSILAGDKVQFAGDTKKYTVSSGDADVSNGGTITIEALTTAIPASATAITLHGASISAAFTATAPTWSDTKQGWYGTGGQANYKFIAQMDKASTLYSYKEYLQKKYFDDKIFVTSFTGNVASSTPFNPSLTLVGGTTHNFTVSGGDILIPVSGVYTISVNTQHASTTFVTSGTSSIRKNGSNIFTTTDYAPVSGATNLFLTLSASVYLDQGDLIDVQGTFSTASSFTYTVNGSIAKVA